MNPWILLLSVVPPMLFGQVRAVLIPGGPQHEDVPADVVLETGHTGMITAMAFSPDGTLLASASDDRHVLLWDPRQGREAARFRHTAAVRSMAFSVDGKLLACGTDDGTISVWDVKKQQPFRKLPASTEPVFHIAIGHDARFLIGAGGSVYGDGVGSVRLWDLTTGKQAALLAPEAFGVNAVFFTADGHAAVASVAGDMALRGTVKLYEAPGGRKTGEKADLVRAVSADGRLIALQSGQWEKATIGVLDLSTGKEAARFPAGSAPIAFSPNGDWVANIVHPGASVVVRRTLTGKAMGTIRGEAWAFERLAVSPDGSTIATAGRGRGIQLWSTRDGAQLRSLDKRPGSVGFAWSRDSKRVVTAGAEIQYWDVETRKPASGPALSPVVLGVAISPDGKLLAAGGPAVQVIDLHAGRAVRALRGPCDVLPSPAFSADGGLVAANCRGIVTVWAVPSGAQVLQLGDYNLLDAGAVAFSPDGRFLVASAGPGRMRVYRTKPEGVAFDLAISGLLSSIAFAPDGRRVALGTRAQVRLETAGGGQRIAPVANQRAVLAVIDLERGRPVFQVPSGDWVSALAFSPDGRTVIAASGLWQQTGRVTVHDVSGGRVLRTAVERVDAENWAAFSPDLTWLAANSASQGALKLWKMR